MLWLALHLPALPLEALQHGVWKPPLALDAQPAALPAQEPQPVAVLAQRRVVQCDRVAHHLGVRPGMNLAAARSLCASLQVLERDLLGEAALVERVALSLSHYTPCVVLRGQGVLLEVRSSCRLFGGSQALLDAAKATVTQLGVQSAVWAAANTAEAAWLLACVGDHLQDQVSPSGKARGASQNLRTKAKIQQRLEALPWQAVLAVWGRSEGPNEGVDPSDVKPLASLLEGLGCRTLADVRALPREGLKRRGGAWLLDRMDQAFGDVAQVHAWWVPPPRFETWLSLMHRIDHAASLVFLVQRLTQPLQGWLTRRGLAATQLALKLRHESSQRREPLADTTLDFRFGDPLRDGNAIGALLRERLLRLKLGSAVYAVGLELQAAQLHGGTPTAFWRHGHGSDPADAGPRLRAMLDRVMVRLGAQQV
jgi:protein ImuB